MFEVEPQVVGKSKGSLSQFWQVGAGTDTMYSIWNPSSEAEDFVVTVNYGSDGVYRFPLHLAANASQMISLKDLIMKQAADSAGHVIPQGTRMGSLSVIEQSADIRNTVTFVMNGGIYNPVAGTCCSAQQTCHGATGRRFLPSPISLVAGTTQELTFYITLDTGEELDYTSSATWAPSSTGNAPLYIQSGGEATAVSAGSVTVVASLMSGVPEYAPQYPSCASCPLGSYGGTTTATVYDATPVITSVSPNQFVVGAATPVVIAGQHFGTNQPQLSVSLGGSVQVNSWNDSQIQAVFNVANAGTGTVQVTAEGYGGQGFASAGGGQQKSQGAQVVGVGVSLSAQSGPILVSTGHQRQLRG